MLNANNLFLSFGDRKILDDVSLSILAKEHIALVGQNGAGKSSLLKILAGEAPDGGKIELVRGVQIGFLKQVPELNPELTVLQTVRLGMSAHLEAIQEHERLCGELANIHDKNTHDRLAKKIDELAQFIEHKGGFDPDYLISTVLSRLGVRDPKQKIASMSGGEQRRCDLARILLQAPDIYLLDEPTNHLDIRGIEFLVDFFKNSRSGVLFVSHDRAFIDDLATRIAELERAKIFWHEPPFANYLENKVIRELIEERSLHRRERLMVNELAWLRAGTPARTTKQNARIDRAYELMDQISKDSQTQRIKQLQAATAKSQRLGRTILELDSLGMNIGDRVLFANLNLKVVSGQRFGILGPNGAGKTTLLAILAGEKPPSLGRIIWGKNTKILKFDQHRQQLDPNATLKETLADHGDYVFIDEQKIHIASYLERYLFSGGDANRRVSSLSGGEQNRLMLAKLFRQPANCLLLDEPTNDLDVSSLAVLEEILLDYDGVVFAVSHDRSFLDRICNNIIAFEPGSSELSRAESQIVLASGNFSDYQQQKARAQAEKSLFKKNLENNSLAKPSASNKIESPKADRIKTKQKLSFKQERELASMSETIERLEAEQAGLHQDLLKPELFREQPKLAKEKLERLKALEPEIERLYARWQELQDLAG